YIVKSGGPSDRDIVGISSDYYKLRGIQFCYTIELPPSNKEAGSLSDKFQPHRSKIKQVVEENFVGILSLYEITRPNKNDCNENCFFPAGCTYFKNSIICDKNKFKNDWGNAAKTSLNLFIYFLLILL
ncbi:unnamed protein product, partial [Oikopleura dioica]